jgi:hypothetical protein
MKEEPIDVLRYALACIWTELEYNEDQTAAIENAMGIAREAKEKLINGLKQNGKILGVPGSTTHGIEAWKERYPNESGH